jgi:hypothetical protein
MNEKEKLEKFRPTFENGGFWEYYLDLERQFQNFLEYVPYLKENEDTYSFKLLSLILSIGGYIDSAFKEMARFPEYSEDEKCMEILRRAGAHQGIIKSGVEAFDSHYGISTKTVTFKFIPDREYVKPFESRDAIPDWWGFYNELKHDVGINLGKANLKNTRDALAAAFLLNVVHKPGAQRLLDYNVLQRGISHEALDGQEIRISISLVKCYISEGKKFPGIVSTPIFIYDYYQQEERKE